MMGVEPARFAYTTQLEDIEAVALYANVSTSAAPFKLQRRLILLGAAFLIAVFVIALPTWLLWHWERAPGIRVLLGFQIFGFLFTFGGFAMYSHPTSFAWRKAEYLFKAMKARGVLDVEIEVSPQGVSFSDLEVTVNWRWQGILAVVPWRKGVMIECTQGTAFIPPRILPPDATPEDIGKHLLAYKVKAPEAGPEVL